MDFTNYKRTKINYGGSEEKIGIKIDNNNYILKFQKESETGLMNNHICEYIGSSVFSLFGETVQITTLGRYQGRKVVVCQDFNNAEDEFVPFNDVGDSSLERDREAYKYTYKEITEMLKENQKLTNVQETIEKFWDLYIYDALLGNFDRHGANWGFIKHKNKYKMSPIFDNGSCLFPRIVTDEQCLKIITNKDELDKRTFKFPTSQIKLTNKKSSYFEVISSLKFDECNQALKRVHKKINLDIINRFIDTIDVLTDIQKQFYKTIIEHRFINIIDFSYKKLEGEKNE